MADLRESRVECRERRSRLVQTLAPRLGVGLVRAGLGLGCSIVEEGHTSENILYLILSGKIKT